MELMSILSILLTLSGWTQYSGATNCSIYLSSQPLTLNLLCPSATCRLEMLNMRGCNNGCPSCNIVDCNREYNLCNTTQSVFNVSNEFSPQQLPSNGQISHSSESPINCTIFKFSRELMQVTCEKEECTLTFQTNNTACSRDLGINYCNQGTGNPSTTCIREYNICMEPQPNTCPSLRETVTITALNQCTSSVTTQTHTKETTTVQVCPSPTISLKMGRTNVLNMSALTNASYLSLPTYTPVPEICSSTMQVFPLNRAIPATGALVGILLVLLVVTTTGWIYTCSRKKEIGLRSQNISLNNNPAYEAETILQRDLAYEVTSISMGEPEVALNQLEPVYEIVQLASAEINTTVKRTGSVKSEDEYDKIN